jgi:hypothetical protein
MLVEAVRKAKRRSIHEKCQSATTPEQLNGSASSILLLQVQSLVVNSVC